MRSPLEMIEGRFEHAVLTTYSFNLQFFEKWVLGALWAAHVRNVIVFVDAVRLGEALDDREASLAGRSYDLVASQRAHLAFHPKLILLGGTDGHRLCVSSANLTPDGQLRNLEVGVCFDSGEPSHRRVIGQGARFLKRISQGDECPPHTVELVERATRQAIELDGPEGPYDFIHNLDEPLSAHFEESVSVRAAAPYATIEAAEAVGGAGLEVIVDGDNLAAPQGFFEGRWRIDARKFERRLHGKAYWIGEPGRGDLIVGSPNLSGAALLRRAGIGNVEAAIAIKGGAGDLSAPPGEPWTDGDLKEAASSRFDASSEADRDAVPTSFNAWIEDGRLQTTGVPNGTEIEVWSEGSWKVLGLVAEGELLLPKGATTDRIRARVNGRLAHAIVADPSKLKWRASSGPSSDEAGAAAKLPLDVETVRVLEHVLGELFELSERIVVKFSGGGGGIKPPDSQGLEEWRPRHDGDEPRIPPLYLDEWRGNKDALLTLISRVLAVDEQPSEVAESQVAEEHFELEDLEEVADQEDPAEDESEDSPTGTREGLRRYRKAFDRLLSRGAVFVSQGQIDELVTSAFVYLLRLINELEEHTVSVDGELEPLGDPRAMLEARNRLLGAFRDRDIEDPVALRAAGPHLAACLREIGEFDSLEQERLERMAFAWGPRLLETMPETLLSEDEETLASYAERSRWPWIAEMAREELEGVERSEDPYPLICGCARFSKALLSPAWALLAFAAPAGLADPDPFAFAVLNRDLDSPAAVHVLAYDPRARALFAAMKRRTDGRWVVSSYDCYSRLDLERFASIPPTAGDWKADPFEVDHLGDVRNALGKIAITVDLYCAEA